MCSDFEQIFYMLVSYPLVFLELFIVDKLHLPQNPRIDQCLQESTSVDPVRQSVLCSASLYLKASVQYRL